MPGRGLRPARHSPVRVQTRRNLAAMLSEFAPLLRGTRAAPGPVLQKLETSMLGLFKRKPTPAPAAPPQPAQPAPEAKAPEWNAIQTSELVMRLLAQFMKTGRFQGTLQDVEGFAARTMDDGIEIASSPAMRTGVVMAENAVGLSIADAAPMQVAMVCIDTTFAHYLKKKPDWNITKTADGGSDFACQIPLIAPYVLSVECKGGEVDPLFDRTMVPGTSLILNVKSVS